MPNNGYFLHKKSLLDRFKDDHSSHTGYIQSARAEHTWNNPLTRRKRTKKLNGWIKSFAGKRHIRKLSRFNAVQAHRHESILKGESTMQTDKKFKNYPHVSPDMVDTALTILKDDYGWNPITEDDVAEFIEDYWDAFVKAYANSGKGGDGPIRDGIEAAFSAEDAKVTRAEYGSEFESKKNEVLVLPNPTIIYRGTSEDAKKASHYISKILADKGLGWGRVSWQAPKDGEYHYGHPEKDVYTVTLRGSNDLIKDSFAVYKDVFGNDFWNNCDANPQGWVDPLTINRYDVATPRQESKESAEYTVHSYNDTDVVHYEDGTPEEWRCKRCGGLEGGEDGEPFGYYITNSKGKTVISPLCSYCVDDACDILNATHGNIGKALGLSESKDTDEKLGYEKGHKNSKGENAPWVIRSHKDNRILASFAKKEDAEEHLQRMMQYSKGESMTNEDLESYACYIDFETEDDAKKGLELVKDWNPLRDGTAVLLDGLGEVAANSLWDNWKHDCIEIGLSISDEGEVYKEEPSCFYDQDESMQSKTDKITQAFKDAADTCGVSDKITITTDGDTVYCVLKMNEDTYGIDHYKWGFNTKTNKLEWYGDESTKTIGARKKFDDMDELKAWIIGDIKALFKTHRYESKQSEEKDRLAVYKPYSFKVKSKDPTILKNDAEDVLTEFAEDVADNTSFKFDYDWYDKSWELTDTKTNQVVRKGTFLFKDFAESPLYLDDGVLATPAGMKLRTWMAVSDEDESKKYEAIDLEGYTSDVISELDVVWGCGEDGATRIAKKYADVIQQNYVDGDLLASETAKFIAGQEHLTESRKKSESKKSEIHLELIETIIVPKWLWEAHVFGKEYGEDLDEHEQEILAKFEEDYGKQYYLDDRSEEADFHSRNDFDSYGGPCYEIDVYEES